MIWIIECLRFVQKFVQNFFWTYMSKNNKKSLVLRQDRFLMKSVLTFFRFWTNMSKNYKKSDRFCFWTNLRHKKFRDNRFGQLKNGQIFRTNLRHSILKKNISHFPSLITDFEIKAQEFCNFQAL